MSKLMLALTAFALGLSRTTAAQTAYVGSVSRTAEVGGLEIGRVPRYRARHPFEAPKPRVERTGRAPSSQSVWVLGFWDLRGNPKTGTGQAGSGSGPLGATAAARPPLGGGPLGLAGGAVVMDPGPLVQRPAGGWCQAATFPDRGSTPVLAVPCAAGDLSRDPNASDLGSEIESPQRMGE
jgi:hypothetical protein